MMMMMVRQPALEKGNSEFKPAWLGLKTEFIPTLPVTERLCKCKTLLSLFVQITTLDFLVIYFCSFFYVNSKIRIFSNKNGWNIWDWHIHKMLDGIYAYLFVFNMNYEFVFINVRGQSFVGVYT